ncbi:MAG: DUF2341 domain-containing protein [Thermodesulfobacteriota bacterium]
MPSNLLVDITSLSSGTAPATWGIVPGLTASGITVKNTSSVLLIIAQVPLKDEGDATAEFRISVNGSATGSPVVTAFTDNIHSVGGVHPMTIMFAVTGLSGSSNSFKCEWQDVISDANMDTAREQSLQVIEITDGDASILVNQSSTGAAASPSTWGNLFSASSISVAGTGSVLLMIANVPIDLSDSSDDTADFQFSVDGTKEGAITSVFKDEIDEGPGWSGMHILDGISGSHGFELQWQTREGQTTSVDTGRLRTFQIVEIKSNAVLKVDVNLTSSATSPVSYADMTGMTGTYTPNASNAIHLIVANFNPSNATGGSAESTTQYRIAVAGTREGSELTTFVDHDHEVTGLCQIWAKTGITASTTFSFQWEDLGNDEVATADTARNRTFFVIEFEQQQSARASRSLSRTVEQVTRDSRSVHRVVQQETRVSRTISREAINSDQASRSVTRTMTDQARASRHLSREVEQDAQASRSVHRIVQKDTRVSRTISREVVFTARASRSITRKVLDQARVSRSLSRQVQQETRASRSLTRTIEQVTRASRPLSRTVAPAVQWFDNDWICRKKVTIDSTKIAENLVDFPVLIRLTSDANLSDDARSDGFDILFTSSDGVTKLNHERVLYVTGTGELIAWVNLPFISGSIDTDIYMYYNNSGATDQQNKPGTWNSNYKGVWHFQEASGNAKDSTIHNTDGIISGGTTQGSTGKIGDAYNFDGFNGQVSMGDPGDGHLDFALDLTVSMWINFNSGGGPRRPIDKGEFAGNAGYSFNLTSLVNGMKFEVEDADGDTQDTSRVPIPTTGIWIYFVGQVDRIPALLRIYENGVEDNNDNMDEVDSSLANSDPFLVSHASQAVNAIMDEIRISDIVHTAGWILSEYNNQNSPSTFHTLGLPECLVLVSRGLARTIKDEGRISRSVHRIVEQEARVSRTVSRETVNSARASRTISREVQQEARQSISVTRSAGSAEARASRSVHRVVKQETRVSKSIHRIVQSEARASRSVSRQVQQESRASRSVTRVVKQEARASRSVTREVKQEARASRTISRKTQAEARVSRSVHRIVEQEARNSRTISREIQQDAQASRSVHRVVQQDDRASRSVTRNVLQEARASRSLHRVVQSEARASRSVSRVIQQEARASRTISREVIGTARDSRSVHRVVQSEARASRSLTRIVQQEARASRSVHRIVQQDARASRTVSREVIIVALASRSLTRTAQQEAKASRSVQRQVQQDARDSRIISREVILTARASRSLLREVQKEARNSVTVSRQVQQEARASRSITRTPEMEDRKSRTVSREIQQETRVSQTISRMTQAQARNSRSLTRIVKQETRASRSVSRAIQNEARASISLFREIQNEARASRSVSRVVQQDAQASRTLSREVEIVAIGDLTFDATKTIKFTCEPTKTIAFTFDATKSVQYTFTATKSVQYTFTAKKTKDYTFDATVR